MKNLSLKKINIIFCIALFVSTVIVLCGSAFENSIISFIGFSGLVGAVIFRVLFYRCPHCGKFLGRDTYRHCPHCGENVNE